MPAAVAAPEWLITTDPDRAMNPDPKETLVPLDLAADAGPDEKTRLFQSGLAWYVCAPGLHAPARPTPDTLYPILLTVAGTPAAIKASRSNFLLGAYGRVHPTATPVGRDHLRLDLLPAGAYRWHQATLTYPGSGQSDHLLTADLPDLFTRDGAPHPQVVRWVLALPPWRQAALRAELAARPALEAAILAHAAAYGLLPDAPPDAPWSPAAPRWTPTDLLAQVPPALEAADLLQRRTYRPIPQSAPFRVQLYLEACRQGLITHAARYSPSPDLATLHAWTDRTTPPVADGTPTAWAQHPGGPALTLHSALPPAVCPIVIGCACSQAALDSFLLDQVAVAHRLNPALLATPNPF